MTEAVPDEAGLVAAFPGAAITYDNAAYFDGLRHQELRANRCAACSRWHLPPQPRCPSCWSTEVVPTAVAGTGTIHLATELTGLDGIRRLVTVELDEQAGLRLSLDLPESKPTGPVIGRRVRLAWPAATGDAVPAPVFVTADGASA